MVKSIDELIQDYVRWLRDGISMSPVGDAFEVTTPFLDRHNDHIQIYVKRDGDRLILTDDGYVIGDLKQSGCALETEHRKTLLRSILNGFGVSLHGEELETVAHNGDFARKKHSLIQAMLAVGDLFATATSLVKSFFLEDVAAFLDAINARYVAGVHFVGRSGFQHRFDFTIAKSRTAPERLIRVLNRPKQDTAMLVIGAWNDVRAIREEAMQMYAILNDSESTKIGEAVHALKQYDIIPVPWSERKVHENTLAA